MVACKSWCELLSLLSKFSILRLFWIVSIFILWRLPIDSVFFGDLDPMWNHRTRFEHGRLDSGTATGRQSKLCFLLHFSTSTACYLGLAIFTILLHCMFLVKSFRVLTVYDRNDDNTRLFPVFTRQYLLIGQLKLAMVYIDPITIRAMEKQLWTIYLLIQ